MYVLILNVNKQDFYAICVFKKESISIKIMGEVYVIMDYLMIILPKLKHLKGQMMHFPILLLKISVKLNYILKL